MEITKEQIEKDIQSSREAIEELKKHIERNIGIILHCERLLKEMEPK